MMKCNTQDNQQGLHRNIPKGRFSLQVAVGTDTLLIASQKHLCRCLLLMGEAAVPHLLAWQSRHSGLVSSLQKATGKCPGVRSCPEHVSSRRQNPVPSGKKVGMAGPI